MKMMEGEFSLANRKTSLTMRGPSPKYFCTKLGSNNTDERRCRVMSHSLGQHCLTTTWRSIHENTSGRVNSDLFVEFKVSERKFDSFLHFLFLHVHPSDVGIGHIRFLIRLEHRDGRVGFRWQNVDQSVGVLVQGHGGRRLQQLP